MSNGIIWKTPSILEAKALSTIEFLKQKFLKPEDQVTYKIKNSDKLYIKINGKLAYIYIWDGLRQRFIWTTGGIK